MASDREDALRAALLEARAELVVLLHVLARLLALHAYDERAWLRRCIERALLSHGSVRAPTRKSVLEAVQAQVALAVNEELSEMIREVEDEAREEAA